MIVEDLSPAQRLIIKKICIKQLDSLRRILYNESDMEMDLTMYLIKNEVSKEEFEEQLEKNIDKFKKLNSNPDDLRVLDDDDLSMFRHLLTNIDKDWEEEYPKAIKNLWGRLFLIENISESGSFTYSSN